MSIRSDVGVALKEELFAKLSPESLKILDPVQQGLDALSRTRILIRHMREKWDEDTAKKPNLLLDGKTFEAILRDLEDSSEIR